MNSFHTFLSEQVSYNVGHVFLFDCGRFSDSNYDLYACRVSIFGFDGFRSVC